MVATGNKRVRLNADLRVVEETVLASQTEPRTPSGWGGQQLHGVEDLKLVRLDDEVVFTGTMAHADGRIGMCIGKYEDILRPSELTMKASCEKNWVFLPGQRSMIYNWHPLQYGPLRGVELAITQTTPMPRLFEMARGSTNGVEFENEWWFVVHFVHKHGNEIRFYYHSIVVLSPQVQLLRYTYPFKFSGTAIEYCLGLVVEPGRLLLTHSANDADSNLLVVSRSAVDALWI